MAYAVYLGRLAFQKVDEHGLPVGDPEIVEKGRRVPDYVRPFEIAALSAAGAIVNLGDTDDEDEVARRIGSPAVEQAPALPNPEVPPTVVGNTVLPGFDTSGDQMESVREQSFPQGFSDESGKDEPARGQASVPGAETTAAVKPNPRDSKAAWEDYAERIGIDRGTAESLTKQELITQVEAREAS